MKSNKDIERRQQKREQNVPVKHAPIKQLNPLVEHPPMKSGNTVLQMFGENTRLQIESTVPLTFIQAERYYESAFQEKEELPPCWQVPQKPPVFIDCTAKITQLEKRFLEPPGKKITLAVIACHGLGGVGKTQIPYPRTYTGAPSRSIIVLFYFTFCIKKCWH